MSSMHPETSAQTQSIQTPMPPAMNPASSIRRNSSSWQEYRPAWLTTELIAYLVTSLGVLIACATITDSSGPGDRDYFTADKAFLYLTLLTIGYMLSRGLAKIGGRPQSDI